MTGSEKIYFVGAGPGGAELITLKGRRLLDNADVIVYAGSLINPELLQGLQAELIDSAKLNLDEIVEVIAKRHSEGKKVVRLHSGDPTIYGAIKEQMERLARLGIPYEIVPGVSSATAVAASLNIELTLPEVSQTVIITRYGKRTPVPEKEGLKKLAKHKATMLIFLSVESISEVTTELLSGYPENTPAAVVQKATWRDERIILGTLKDIARKAKDANIEKTAIIVVGDVLKDETLKAVSRLYDKRFAHGYRE